MKHTAHRFQDILRCGYPFEDQPYEVWRANKRHEFWQRESLAIELYSTTVARQKLNYIHQNPVRGKWQLAASPSEYRYSSAAFYKGEVSEFKFLKNIWEYL